MRQKSSSNSRFKWPRVYYPHNHKDYNRDYNNHQKNNHSSTIGKSKSGLKGMDVFSPVKSYLKTIIERFNWVARVSTRGRTGRTILGLDRPGWTAPKNFTRSLRVAGFRFSASFVIISSVCVVLRSLDNFMVAIFLNGKSHFCVVNSKRSNRTW